MRRAAGTLPVVLGLGLGVPCVFGMRRVVKTGEVRTFMGFATYGDGPFGRGVP